MSASIPKRTALDSLGEEGGVRTKWIVLSILAHVILLAWIFSLKTPTAQELNDAAAKNGAAKTDDAAAQPTPLDDKLAASPERIEEVAKQINDIQADQVKDKVQELLATEQELAEVNKEKLQDFAALAKELTKDAPEKIDAALDAATKAQDEARQAEEAALKAATGVEQAKLAVAAAAAAMKAQSAAAVTSGTAATATSGTTAAAVSGTAAATTSGTAATTTSGTTAATTSGTATAGGAAPAPVTPADIAALKLQVTAKEEETKAAQEKAKDAQAAASDAQTKAMQQLAFEGDAFAAAKKALDGATAAQEEANNKQDAAASRVNNGLTWADSNLWAKQQAVDSARRTAYMIAGQLDTQQKALDASKTQTQQSTDALQKAENAAKDAKDKLQQAATDKEKAAAKTNSTKADQAVVKIQDTLIKQLDRNAKAMEHVQTTQQKLGEAKQKTATAEGEFAQAKIAVENAPRKAVEGQQDALTAQQKAAELQAQVKGEVAKAAIAEKAMTADVQPDTSASGTSAGEQNLDGQNFAQLYQTAVNAEKNIAEKYKDIRAAESAKLRQIPISEAAKSIQVALPVRPELDPAIAAGNIKSAEALNVHNAAMEGALQQIDSMVAVARGMAYQAHGRQEMNVSVADMKAEADQAAKLAELATENEGTVSADVSEMMKQMEEGNGKHEQEGGDGPDLGGSGASGKTAGSGPDKGGGGSADSQGNGEGSGSGSGKGRRGFIGGNSPPPVEHVADSIPGRKVHSEGEGVGAKWMYIDTWYVIGPFPNPARRNIDTKFPPDSVIDLDASYTGKNDKLIHWQFLQAAAVAIHPPDEQPYAIYYAYTTLWFDEPRDMWIAIGSDDFSKIWINDMLVWASGRIQKAWAADEGFRKVHFKKGLNRILDRVENGQNTCMFSVMLNMHKK